MIKLLYLCNFKFIAVYMVLDMGVAMYIYAWLCTINFLPHNFL